MPDHVTAGYGKPHMSLAAAALKIELLKDEVRDLKRQLVKLQAANRALRQRVAA